jgi:hypothetical protein
MIRNPEKMCLYAWLDAVMMANSHSRREIGMKAQRDGFDSAAAVITFDMMKESGEIVPVGGGQYLDKDIANIKPNPSGLSYKTAVRGPIAMDTPDGPVVLYRNPREYPWLSLALVNKSEPAMKRKGVSKVARGAQKSTQTREGFMQAYRRTKGSKAKMKTRSTGHGDQTWAERRHAFIARHLKQMKNSDTHSSGWTPSGEPTRRHLGLIAWAYSPTPSRLRKWLDK